MEADRVLIEKFQKEQDKAAFDQLVIKHQDKVFNICYRFMGNYHDAGDCAQDTFVKVFRSLKNFKFQSAFSTWLYRIAVNTCKSKLTSLGYRLSKMMVRIDKGGTEEGDLPLEIKDTSLSPESEFDKSEQSKQIQKAIDSLPADHKTVVVLCDIESLSYEEIVKVTGYNMGTVKSKINRARARLREKLRGLV